MTDEFKQMSVTMNFDIVTFSEINENELAKLLGDFVSRMIQDKMCNTVLGSITTIVDNVKENG